jgi:hypothetical protein
MIAGHELVRTIEVGDRWILGVRSFDAVVKIFRDAARGDFFARVYRREMLRVNSSMNRIADEEIEIIDREAQGALRAKEVGRVAQMAMRMIKRAKAPKDRQRKQFAALLMHTVELGPYEVAGETPMMFVVKVYKSLDKPKTFFPIVFRRDTYLLKPSFKTKARVEELEVVDSNYESRSFERASASASLKAIVATIRKTCEGPQT